MVFRLLIAAGIVAVGLADASAQTGTRATRKNASIAGRIIHTDGTAAEGARIAVYAVREGAPAGIVGTATSGHDGRYEVSGLPAGRFAVGATPQRIRGFGGDSRRLSAPATETLYPGTTDRMKAHAIAVFDDTPTEGIDIWLEPAAQRYSISGRVMWPDDAAVEKIVIEYGGPEDVHNGIWHVTDPGGLFTVEGASRGTHVLLARSETANGPLIGIAATDVMNDSVLDVRLTLRRPGSIEGRVVVEGNGSPDLSSVRLTPTQALLTVSPLYPVDDAALDATGRFTMPHLLGKFTIAIRGLPQGWRVRGITRAGAALPDNHVTVVAGQRTTGIEVAISNSP